MCGRFAQFSIKPVLIEEFNLDEVSCDLKPNYNIAPGQDVAVVIRDDRTRLLMLHWGLVPPWAKDISAGYKMINARSETITEKPSYRKAFEKRRCLVIADGFYEWHREGNKKIPYFIYHISGRPVGFAGIYEKWISKDGDEVNSCAIITTSANELLQPIHDRMPVIIPAENSASWIDPANKDKDHLLSMLAPFSSGRMSAHKVSEFVNSPANNSPECIKPDSI